MRIATWNVNSLKVRLQRVEEWLSRRRRPTSSACRRPSSPTSALPAPHLRGARLRVRAPRRGPVERRGHPQPGRPRRRRQRLRRRRRRPTPRRGSSSATLRRRAASSASTCPTGARSTTTTTSTSCAGSARLRPHARRHSPRPATTSWSCGDFNIAPDRPRRVRPVGVRRRDPRQPARARRARPPSRRGASSTSSASTTTTGRLFSWWDYRAGDFHKGRGMRIDLVLATGPLADRVDWVRDRPQRPQGHAAVRPRPGGRRLRRLTNDGDLVASTAAVSGKCR